MTPTQTWDVCDTCDASYLRGKDSAHQPAFNPLYGHNWGHLWLCRDCTEVGIAITEEWNRDLLAAIRAKRATGP